MYVDVCQEIQPRGIPGHFYVIVVTRWGNSFGNGRRPKGIPCTVVNTPEGWGAGVAITVGGGAAGAVGGAAGGAAEDKWGVQNGQLDGWGGTGAGETMVGAIGRDSTHWLAPLFGGSQRGHRSRR